jgi:hypothetical protein
VKKAVTIAILLFSLMAGFGQAGSKGTRWRSITMTENFDYRLDTRTVRRPSGDLVQAWVKEQVHPNFLSRTAGRIIAKDRREKVRLSTEGYDDFDSEVLLYEINCSAGRMRSLQTIDYTETGTILGSTRTPKSNWLNVAPDSIGEKILNAVCSYKPMIKPPRN